MFSPYWDAAPTADFAAAWADYGDHAEAIWSDADEDDLEEDPWPQGDIFAA